MGLRRCQKSTWWICNVSHRNAPGRRTCENGESGMGSYGSQHDACCDLRYLTSPSVPSPLQLAHPLARCPTLHRTAAGFRAKQHATVYAFAIITKGIVPAYTIPSRLVYQLGCKSKDRAPCRKMQRHQSQAPTKEEKSSNCCAARHIHICAIGTTYADSHRAEEMTPSFRKKRAADLQMTRCTTMTAGSAGNPCRNHPAKAAPRQTMKDVAL